MSNQNRFRSMYITDSINQADALVPSASIHLADKNKAFIPNRLTTAERDALTAVNGMLIFNTTTGVLNYYNGSWSAVGGGGGMTQFIYDTDNDDNNYYLTSAMNGGHIYIIGDTSYDVEVPDDSDELPIGFSVTIINASTQEQDINYSEGMFKIVGGDFAGDETGYLRVDTNSITTLIKVASDRFIATGTALWNDD